MGTSHEHESEWSVYYTVVLVVGTTSSCDMTCSRAASGKYCEEGLDSKVQRANNLREKKC